MNSRDNSVRRLAKKYTAEFMSDGKEHVMGEVIKYATGRFENEGQNFAKASIKAAVDFALGDMTAFVWLGYGRYQSKASYIRTHDLNTYACRRIAEALGRAVRDITNCYETDLTINGTTDSDLIKVRAAVKSILHSLSECEKIIQNSDKSSVLRRIAEAREQPASADKPRRGRHPKSRGEAL
jgi:hypothetical protein